MLFVRHSTISALPLPSSSLFTLKLNFVLTHKDIGSRTDSLSSNTMGVTDRVFNNNDNETRPVMLFDGECYLCNSAVNQMIDWDPQGKLRFAALQSRVGQSLLQEHGRKPDDVSSIVVVTHHDGACVKSDAVLAIIQELNVP